MKIFLAAAIFTHIIPISDNALIGLTFYGLAGLVAFVLWFDKKFPHPSDV